MPPFATTVAVLLYLLPIAAVLLVRSTRGRAAWELALDVPMVVALDLLLIHVLARFMTVETAVLASRPLWAIGTGAWWYRRRRRGERIGWPRAIKRGHVASILLAVAAAVGLSMVLSRTKMMWDREWHMPLATSLRGQRLPFHNVFEPDRVLHYHVTGNILGAELEVLSRDVISGAFALSLMHDVMFGLTAFAIGLATLHFSGGRRAPIFLAPLFLLVGPFTLRGGIGEPSKGYSFHNFLSLSFRPHVPLSGLLLTGFTVAVLVRLRDLDPPPLRLTLPPLLASAAALGLTDESATGLLGLSLGFAWLVYPNVIAKRRLTGILCFIGLAAAFLGPNLAFSAALSPGGPLQKVTQVPWRNPGFGYGPLPLSIDTGKMVLACDILPFALCAVGVLFAFVRRPSRRLGATLLFVSVLCGVSVFALTGLEINAHADNVQRFMVAPIFVAPLVGVLALDQRWCGSIARGLVLAGLTAGAFCTLLWLREDAPRTGTPSSQYNPPGYDLYDVDCRRAAGARVGELASPAYVDGSLYQLYVTCRPVYAPGGERAREIWNMKIFPDPSPAGFALFDAELGAAPLRVVCPASSPGDSICSRVDRKACVRAGEAFVECTLSAEARAKLR